MVADCSVAWAWLVSGLALAVMTPKLKKSKVDITQTWAVRMLQIVFWLWPETYHYHRLRIVACSDFSVRLQLTAQLGADRLKA